MTSYLPCTQGEKARDSERQKAVVHIGFRKLCTVAVHADTAELF